MRIAFDCTPATESIGHGIGVYARSLVGALARLASPDDRFELSYESRRWHARRNGIAELDARFKQRRLWPVPVRPWWGRKVDVFHAPEGRLPRARFAREIVTFQDMYPFHRYLWQDGGKAAERYNTKRLKRYPEIAERATSIICTSLNTRDDLLRIAPQAAPKVTIIPLATSAGEPGRVPAESEVSAAVREAARGRYFVHLGSMWRIRNLPTTIRAFARVARAHPGVRLLVVGEPGKETPEILRVVGELGLGDAVLFPGVVSEAEKYFLLSRAAALVMFHLYAGFGLPVVEAMALGVPVLASNRGALPEVGGDAGVYLDVEDESGMAAAMARVLDDAAFARRLSDAGRARAPAYTWDAVARQTYALYQRLVEG